MAQAIYNKQIIASSEDTVTVDGYVYFPLDAVDMRYLRPSDHTTWCGWKGQASYFHVEVGEELTPDAAWQYREPKPDAQLVEGRIAFWKKVTVLP